MRERIARAMCSKMSDLPWDSLYPVGREDYLCAADAVLSELETPTDAMGQEIADFAYMSIGRWVAEDGKQAFTAAIRAAREGK